MKLAREKQFFKKLSREYDIPVNVLTVICNSPFKFAVDTMQSEKDMKDIMFAYLFKLKLKPRFKKHGTKKTEELPPESRFTNTRLSREPVQSE